MTGIAERTLAGSITSVVEITPLTRRIGAEVSGVDLSSSIDDAQLREIRAALARWRVLFFRGQFLSHAEHAAFATKLGPLVYPHFYDEDNPPARVPDEIRAAEGFPELFTVDNLRSERQRASVVARGGTVGSSANSYRGVHVDSSAAVNPPTYSVLRADVLPPFGGDTTWFDLVAAYEGLGEPIRQFVDTLWVEHRFGSEFDDFLDEERKNAEHRTAHHPLVRVIPETGERALLLNPVLPARVLDVSPDESTWILDFLYEEVTRPAYSVRFRWEPGDLAVSDNRTTAHLGPQDLPAGVDRVLHLAEVEGDVPISVEGRRSEQIAGIPLRRKQPRSAS